MQQTQTVQDWGQALMVSLSVALASVVNAVPRVIGFLLILVIGWLIAGLVAAAAGAILRSVKFNELAQRSGFGTFVKNAGLQGDPASIIADVVKWGVRLIALVVAFDALGLPAVSDVLRQLLLWLPNLVVGLVVLVVAGLAAGALSRIVRGATASAGFSNPDLLAGIASVAVWSFGIVVAVNQLGIATTLINTLFMAVVGAVAVAVAIAFGLGGRDTAAEIVRGWYRRGQAELPQAADRLREGLEAQRQAPQPGQQPRQV